MRSQRHLWAAGISGDRPILLLRIDAIEDLEIVRQLLKAHEYLNSKHFAVDLVFLNEKRVSYIQDLQLAIEEQIRKTVIDTARVPTGGGQVFALRADILPQDTLVMLPSVARVVLHARSGTLSDQLTRLRGLPLPQRVLRKELAEPFPAATAASRPDGEGLEFFNGFGGFDKDANEYVIHSSPRSPTPAPWINVIANPDFGMHCSAEGPGPTWSGNSRECQITPWSNDPVRNPSSEVIYVRDSQSGVVTSPCMSPLMKKTGTFRTRHGFGYSVYHCDDAGLSMELLQFVPLQDTVKLGRLRIAQKGGGRRQLSITYFVDLVLGAQRSASAPHIFTQIDEETGALFAQNIWNDFFGGRVVFVDLCGSQASWSGDRLQFIGRYGSLSSPLTVMNGEILPNTTGAGLDPCAALQANLTLQGGAPEEFRILLGSAASEAEARMLIRKYRETNFDAALSEVKSFWKETLGAVQVNTPDPSFDFVMNGWLLYQTLACRMFGRAGFYQASGAYGMRDQLQDSMAIVALKPGLAREHLLRAAGRQFPEGDLQHWWLPQSGAGIRTRISDDCVWLAYCVHHYVKVTGDADILDESVPFLEGRRLEEGEHEAYFEPSVSLETATIYEHCARALDRSLVNGPHGLPLFGTGDWNDGMNRVGERGQGESVWLGWFLYTTLGAFRSHALARGDAAHAGAWKQHMDGLSAALNAHGWDGQWYRRGYFDDGTPLGSSRNAECRIDCIAQSWAVLSGAAAPDRATAALAKAYEQLVKPDQALALLFAPPFDTSLPDPGYIKAYPPGIRENGGQYTHAAVWSIFAHAKLGEADRAGQLFAMLNPINHARTLEEAMRYRVEPYVVAADIYSVGDNSGRGGWTWYTGAAGWLYRAGLEAILGVSREGETLLIQPCIPPTWQEYSLRYRFGSTDYNIKVSRDGDANSIETGDVEHVARGTYRIRLRDNGGTINLYLILEKARQGNVADREEPNVSPLRPSTFVQE
jgi:cyclic beta-1,2-glucan synthetase